ncbi:MULTISPECIES: laminin B domain-containing protein [Aerosakkonema]|uniref:laminin B domain-containing protein n=1 Tax=Aerosakkonema TaxID=1246629 RepID=UPI0035B8B917
MKTTRTTTKNNAKFIGRACIRVSKAFAIGASILTFAAVSPFKTQAATLASSTFDNGIDGWVIDDFISGNSVIYTPTYFSTEGNPGGYIQDTDRSTGGWVFKAPTKFLGDMSAAYNGILSFDSIMPLKGIESNSDDVAITGGGYTLLFNNPNNPGVNWTSYSISLNEAAGWKVAATGLAPTQAQMLAVLSSLNDLRILGEYSNGPETVGLDNVVISSGPKSVPEPTSTLGLLALGAVGASSMLWRKKASAS